MELTLKRLLEHAEFPKYRGKGYDPAAVDEFLDKAAAMAAKVEVQLTQALEAAQSGGGPSPEDIQAEVERRVSARLAEEAEQRPAGASEEETAEEVRRTIIMAQRTADAAVREAREDAEKIVGSAKDQAETLVSDAEARAAALRTESEELAASSRQEVEAEAVRERREARQRLAAEIAELEAIRETLRTDVTVLERHVTEQRSQLSSTLDELRTLLDDPTGFRMAPPPALEEPELPDFSDLDESEPATEDGLAGADVAPAEEPEAAAAEPTPEPPILEAAADDAGAHVDVDQPGPDVEPAEAAEAPVADAPAADEPEQAADAPASEPAEVDDPPPGPPTVAAPSLSFGGIEHEPPGVPDAGPPTAPVSPVELGVGPPADDEDPFLTELRKAMADDEPLGPRDDPDPPPQSLFGDDESERRRRFGRRR